MADTKEDIFALEKPNGLPAYPKMIHKPTGEKARDGSDIMDLGTIVKTPEEHKKFLAAEKPAWSDSKK